MRRPDVGLAPGCDSQIGSAKAKFVWGDGFRDNGAATSPLRSDVINEKMVIYASDVTYGFLAKT